MSLTLTATTNLEAIQHKARFAISWLVAVHAPIVLLVASQMGNISTVVALATMIAAALGVVLHHTRQHPVLVGNTIGVTYMLQVMLLVALLKGHPWQVDMHMYFFAAIGILACLLDWRPIVFATVAVAAHHLVLDFAIPSYVFPSDKSNLARVILHAVIVLLESGALIVMCLLVRSSFLASTKAQQTAEDALVQVRESVAIQEQTEQRARQERQQFITRIADEFEHSVKTIAQAVMQASGELSQRASAMAGNVSESSRLSSAAATTADTMSGNVQSVASAVEELSASVREISGQLQKTNGMVQESTTRTQNADQLAATLTRATTRVGEVMGMISGIASQINLLALNATIESARAGEAGRGFAVVAGEVKNLAGQTDRSIAEIQTVVEEMRAAASSIAQALSEIRESVEQIAGAATTVAAAVEEQSATTGEISRSMQSAASGTRTISENLENVNSVSREANDSAQAIRESATALSQQATTLGGHVDTFLQKIRSA